jgi:exopolysaccharide biosynthesis protein
MKRRYIVVVLLIIFLLTGSAYSAAESPVRPYQKKVTVNKASRTVNIAEVDLKSKDIRLEAAIANDKIRTVEDFSGFVKRKGAMAAINANYFAAYSDFSPVGTIACNGDYKWSANYGTSVYISDGNDLIFRSADYYGKARIYINMIQQQDYIWQLNRMDLSKEAILFTNKIEEPVKLKQGVCVFLKNGFISEVRYAPFDLTNPEGGIVLYFNKPVDQTLKDLINTKYKAGQQVYYERVKQDKGSVDWSKYGNVITAGPRLLVDGKVEVDPAAEGFTEKKITEYRAQRSSLGLTKDNRLLLVTVSNVTIYELADIMKNLGAYQALNLDGGASSALYANGKMITYPGRKLSIFLTVQKRDGK